MSYIYPIPPYHAFMNFTPVIPAYYQDVYSPEEVIKKMLFEQNKFKEYLNNMAAVINSMPTGSYTLPPASATTLGGVKVGDNISVSEDGSISIAAPTPAYTLPPASATTLGGVKAGEGVEIAADGTISAQGGSGGAVPEGHQWSELIDAISTAMGSGYTVSAKGGIPDVDAGTPLDKLQQQVSYGNIIADSVRFELYAANAPAGAPIIFAVRMNTSGKTVNYWGLFYIFKKAKNESQDIIFNGMWVCNDARNADIPYTKFTADSIVATIEAA